MDIGILVPLLGVSIPVIALLRSPLRDWIAHRERQMEIDARRGADSGTYHDARTERLEQRVAVLERILTDRSTRLGDEIDRLREAPIN